MDGGGPEPDFLKYHKEDAEKSGILGQQHVLERDIRDIRKRDIKDIKEEMDCYGRKIATEEKIYFRDGAKGIRGKRL